MSGSASWNPINIRHVMRRFLIKKTGDCSGSPTPKKNKIRCGEATHSQVINKKEGDEDLRLLGLANECRWQTPRSTADGALAVITN